MTVTSVIENDNELLSNDGNDRVLVFNSENICVGIGIPSTYFPPIDANLIFLMIYSNDIHNNDYLIKIYDASNNSYTIINDFTFVSNSDVGSISEPYIFSHVTVIQGCTDSLAINFNPQANFNDNSCIQSIYGCTDNSAFNFDPNANTDDDSCIPFVFGCTDSLAFNFDPNANSNDSSCIDVVYGCTDSLSPNFSINANIDDSSCISWEENFSILLNNHNLLQDSLDQITNNYNEILLLFNQTQLELALANTTLSELNSELATANSSITNLDT